MSSLLGVSRIGCPRITGVDFSPVDYFISLVLFIVYIVHSLNQFLFTYFCRCALHKVINQLSRYINSKNVLLFYPYLQGNCIG